jgi:hypothetical protein
MWHVSNAIGLIFKITFHGITFVSYNSCFVSMISYKNQSYKCVSTSHFRTKIVASNEYNLMLINDSLEQIYITLFKRVFMKLDNANWILSHMIKIKLYIPYSVEIIMWRYKNSY